jgi:hypothetical protein
MQMGATFSLGVPVEGFLLPDCMLDLSNLKQLMTLSPFDIPLILRTTGNLGLWLAQKDSRY